jgi:Uma2 family endonuclease
MRSVTLLPQNRPLTRSDLETMPDDGHRYELVDGALVVTPAPSPLHQLVSGRLFLSLAQACPPDLAVLYAPLDVALSDTTVLQPDLLVARRADLTARDLPTAPLLAVEILSPSTRLIDLNLKRARYEEAGCPSYWVIDPEVPALTAWVLRGSTDVEAGHVVGDETFTAESPVTVRVCPARLLD